MQAAEKILHVIYYIILITHYVPVKNETKYVRLVSMYFHNFRILILLLTYDRCLLHPVDLWDITWLLRPWILRPRALFYEIDYCRRSKFLTPHACPVIHSLNYRISLNNVLTSPFNNVPP